MSGKGGKKRGAGDDGADPDAVAAAFADSGPKVKAGTDFEVPDAAWGFLGAQAVDAPASDDSGKAATEFAQLKEADKRTLLAETRRYILLKALGGAGTLRAADVAKAVLRAGLYGNPRHIKGPFLVAKVAGELRDDYGVELAHAHKTFTVAEFEQDRKQMEKDEVDLKMPGFNYIVRRSWARTREESQTLAERDPLAAAKRGLLFVVLGLIMCDKHKALPEEDLLARLADEFGLPEDADGPWREDGMARWRTIVKSELPASGYLIRDTTPPEGDEKQASKYFYRIGPKSRGCIGTPSLLAFMYKLTGTVEPAEAVLRASLGPEAAGMGLGEASSGKGPARKKAKKAAEDDDE